MAADLDAALDDEFATTVRLDSGRHPILPRRAIALTLRLLGGLTTEEIARAFLVSEPTIAQRIVRAKRTLAKKRIPFEVPRGAERAARLSTVLEVIYLIFNEGYTATTGADWMRPALCEDALRLGRSWPAGPRKSNSMVWSADGNPAIAHSGRVGPRAIPSGSSIEPIASGSTTIRRGLAGWSGQRTWRISGSYVLAPDCACHAEPLPREPTGSHCNRSTLRLRLAPSPCGAEPAVRVAMALGPEAGLDLSMRCRVSLAQHYHLLPSVRGDLSPGSGFDEAVVSSSARILTRMPENGNCCRSGRASTANTAACSNRRTDATYYRPHGSDPAFDRLHAVLAIYEGFSHVTRSEPGSFSYLFARE